MVWIPEVDEKPFGLLKTKNSISFGVAKVGRFTEKMHNLKEGDLIGVRGPYGNGFEIIGDRALAVAGGNWKCSCIKCCGRIFKKRNKYHYDTWWKNKKRIIIHGKV